MKTEGFTIMFILVGFISQKAGNKLPEGPPWIFSSMSLTTLDYLTLSWGHKTKCLLNNSLFYISQYYEIWERRCKNLIKLSFSQESDEYELYMMF